MSPALARPRLAVLLVAVMAVSGLLWARAPGSAVAAGGGSNPNPTPPNQSPGICPGDILAPVNQPIVLLNVTVNRRWFWSLRSLDGRVVETGRTNSRGVDSIMVDEPVMLLDVPEAGLFGQPISGGMVVAVSPTP